MLLAEVNAGMAGWQWAGYNGMQWCTCGMLQVSHHPPVCAAHAENSHFMYDLVSAPTTKFLGNSLEVYPYGEGRVQLGCCLLGLPNSHSHVPRGLLACLGGGACQVAAALLAVWASSCGWPHMAEQLNSWLVD